MTVRSVALLLSVVLLHVVLQHKFVAYAAKCGRTVLEEDFNDYPGKYKYISSDDGARKLFPMATYIGSGVGLDRLQVGEKVAKVNIRKGLSPPYTSIILSFVRQVTNQDLLLL